MKNSSSATHFGWYEIVRILVPGFYFVFLCYLYSAVFSLSIYPFDTWEIGVPTLLLGGLVAGLTLYAKESPKKRKAFQSNQPSHFIRERSRRIKNARAMDEDDARRLYFYLLNNYMPGEALEKIYFFGTVYHVMISIRRTSFGFGAFGLAMLLMSYAAKGHFDLLSLMPVAVVWLVYGLNVRFNKADRNMQENYHDQIFWLMMNATLVDELITQRMHLEPTA